MGKISIFLASPPNRELLVAQLFDGDHQLGELNEDAGSMMLEIFPHSSSKPWEFEVDELIEALQEAKRRLKAGSQIIGPQYYAQLEREYEEEQLRLASEHAAKKDKPLLE